LGVEHVITPGTQQPPPGVGADVVAVESESDIAEELALNIDRLP
jgi:hypothetical protein